MDNCVLYWMRRDLRIKDNHALFEALKSGFNVIPLFIFDTYILNELPKNDARVSFIYHELKSLKAGLQKQGSDLIIRYGDPVDIFRNLIKEKDIKGLYFNKDYEPYAIQRDNIVIEMLRSAGIKVSSFKDHVIFEGHEILKEDGSPYSIFTPYMKKWKRKFIDEGIDSYPSEEFLHNFAQMSAEDMIGLNSMGFAKADIAFPAKDINRNIIKNYDKTRNFPGHDLGTSRLGVHFRFGTISIREKVKKSASLNETYLNELIWRDFYSQILFHFPQVIHQSYRPAYDRIAWINDNDSFTKWCDGRTGYPLVDAGMRELNNTGYMHNRVRMVVASFLTKHLLIDWRWGEAYFAKKLLDYDLASNNGGWQWAAGCGTDAAPYFRIFNPQSQLEKFDKDHIYIKRWIPEYGTASYSQPIVEHKFARERCLATYKTALNQILAD